MELPVLPLFQEPQHYPGPAYGTVQGGASSNTLPYCMANINDNDDSPREATLFCFATFADKHTGALYNNLTGLFPFQSLKGNVCFLVVYHYKTNPILALPINGFSKKISLQHISNNMKCLNQRVALSDQTSWTTEQVKQ
jgi:hypothetical protein